MNGRVQLDAKKSRKLARSGNNAKGFRSFGFTSFLVSVTCKAISDDLTFFGNMIRVSLERILSHTNRY